MADAVGLFDVQRPLTARQADAILRDLRAEWKRWRSGENHATQRWYGVGWCDDEMRGTCTRQGPDEHLTSHGLVDQARERMAEIEVKAAALVAHRPQTARRAGG
jgi:hypothetical protein